MFFPLSFSSFFTSDFRPKRQVPYWRENNRVQKLLHCPTILKFCTLFHGKKKEKITSDYIANRIAFQEAIIAIKIYSIAYLKSKISFLMVTNTKLFPSSCSQNSIITDHVIFIFFLRKSHCFTLSDKLLQFFKEETFYKPLFCTINCMSFF